MGDQYIKVDGVWTKAKRPYVKRNGIWTPVMDTYIKQSGTWNKIFQYDVIPPNPPELTLQLLPTSSPRYIKVGSRLPGAGNDTTLRRIRVLASRDKDLTTQFGDGYIYGNDADYPKENWSDWWYNNSNPDKTATGHPDSSVYNYKQFPLNPTDQTNLPGGQWYKFAAWSQDQEGNWSTGVFLNVWMPKEGKSATKTIVKEIRAQANQAGSTDTGGLNFTAGDVTATDNPRSNGIWFHGNQFTDSVGSLGSPSIQVAQIRVSRKNDSFQGTANVNLYWHGHTDPSTLPIPSGDRNDQTKVGTLNKSTTDWFDIPSAWYSKFNTQIKGFGLGYGTNAQDDISAKGLADDLRCGEVHLIWEEAL